LFRITGGTANIITLFANSIVVEIVASDHPVKAVTWPLSSNISDRALLADPALEE